MLRLISRLTSDTPQPLIDAGLPSQLARVLWARGVRSAEEAQAFLHPDLLALHDPFLLRDMDKAVSRIRKAVESGENIVIYGDYDVDGVCASTILVEVLRAKGAFVDWYIPSRHKEGYGLNEDAVQAIASRASLMVTVDGGITALVEAALARELGLDLIITDHHEPLAELPDALAVIDPLLGSYPFQRLCGAGVAWKLAIALFGLEAAMPSLELAALATVADLVPLLDENRILVYHGLIQMQTTSRAGLKALMKVSGLSGKVVTAGHLGFQIGPRVNAGGRLNEASRNVELLLTKDTALAERVAAALSEENTQRQRMEAEILSQAEQWVFENVDFLTEKVIIVVGKGWNTGVVGLAASRLVEKYAWPAVVLSEMDGICTGSARSIPGVNLHTALTRCQDLFIRFGGHAQAAGMTLPCENLPVFRARLNEAIADIAEWDAFIPAVFYDMDLRLVEITIPLIEEMNRLAPTGFGNPSPVFRLSGAEILEARSVGVEGKHLKIRLMQDGTALDGIAFGQGDMRAALPERVDALFSPTINEFMGRRGAQCEIARIFPHMPGEAFRKQCLASADDFDFYLLDGMPAPMTPEPEAVLRALAGESLSSSAQGTLLTVRTLEGALNCLAWLDKVGLAGRLTYCFNAPEDSRRFNALCAMPNERAEKGFARVFSMDDGLVSKAAAAWLPSDEGLRTLYRVLRAGQGRFVSEAALSEAAAMRLAAVRLGLRTFAELGLVAYHPVPFYASVLSARRCSLEDSAILLKARRMVQGEVEA